VGGVSSERAFWVILSMYFLASECLYTSVGFLCKCVYACVCVCVCVCMCVCVICVRKRVRLISLSSLCLEHSFEASLPA